MLIPIRNISLFITKRSIILFLWCSLVQTHITPKVLRGASPSPKSSWGGGMSSSVFAPIPLNPSSVASRPKIRPNNSKQPEFQPSVRRKIWAEFLAEFLIFSNIGRKQPELSKFSTNIHNIHFRFTKSVKLS